VSGRGALTVAWRGTNGHLWVIRRSGQSWGKPVDRGMGKLGSAPAVTGLASGLVDVFWAATSHQRDLAPEGCGTSRIRPDPAGARPPS
jgi:hypothetical protein